MGCDLVFKLNNSVKGLFNQSLDQIVIRNSSIESDENLKDLSEPYKEMYSISLLNIANELKNTPDKLKELVDVLQNIPRDVRSVSATDIQLKGIISNYTYNDLKSKYTGEVTFPNFRTPYNPDILLVKSLYLNGISYKDVIFSNDANGKKIYVVSDSKEGVERLIRHLELRDMILNDYEDKPELLKLMPKLAKAGKAFDNLKELLLDFIERNSEYEEMDSYGFLTEIVKNLLNPERIGYRAELDREFAHRLSYKMNSNIATISISKFTEFLEKFVPDLANNDLKNIEVLKQVFNKLNELFSDFSGKFVELLNDTISIKVGKFLTLGDTYNLTYSTINELIKHTGEVYKGFHIYQWTNGELIKYLYNQGGITPYNGDKTFNSIDEIYKDIDKRMFRNFTFKKGFDLNFRAIPDYERVNSIVTNRFYFPGTVVKVLNIPLNKDIYLNKDEKAVVNGDVTIDKFYELFKSQLNESQYGLLQSVVNSIETAGIFIYLINERAGSDIESRMLQDNSIFNEIILEISDATMNMNYKEYFIQECTNVNNKYFTKIIPLDDSIEIHEKFNRPKPIIGLILEVVDVFNEKFGVGATVLNSQEIAEQFPDVPANTKAFIFNGNIYINGSIATSEDVIHEYTHLILGAFKATNFDAYMKLLELVAYDRNASRYRRLVGAKYKHLARPDFNEEVFVAAFADFLAGKNPSNIFKQVKKEIDKNMKTIFNYASEEDFNSLYKKKFYNILQLFSKDIGKIGKEFDFSKGKVYREAANWISKLIEQQEIKEICK